MTRRGGVPERSNGAVLKTAGRRKAARGFESHPRRARFPAFAVVFEMDETRWLRRLVEACRAAKEKLKDSPRARKHELGEAFDDLCVRLERRLQDAERKQQAA